MKILFLGLLFNMAFILGAQPTVGVITKTDDALDGYTFFSPFSGTKAYLIDNCGNLINEWDRGTNPGLSAYFLENGLMFRTFKINPVGPFTSASNAGGLELVDWNNNVVWQYTINTSEQLSHHDAVMMRNGNILVLTWELTYREELIELGRDPNEIAPQNYMWSEKILELQPIGQDSATIVWQWHINDHFIQDFDSSKTGFGVVSDHPELYDINHPRLNSNNSNTSRDWFHFNAIDYNAALDQILISVRNSDEIWIIDHSTTTAEAAGHTGGIYGKGGDILYRWGNPSSYKAAPISDQMLWGQHGVNWIPEGLSDEGMIMVFNNGNGKPGTDFSQVQILNPPQSSNGFYTKEDTDPFGPVNATTLYGDNDNETFYSAFLSNAIRLKNGNTLINSGSPGRIFEVTPTREIVWEYEIPLSGDIPFSQGSDARNNGNFRAYKYASDYSGFEGLDLTPGPPIELDPIECELSTSTTSVEFEEYNIRFNANSNSLLIDTKARSIKHFFLSDINGNLLEQSSLHSITAPLQYRYAVGVYIATIQFTDGKSMSQKVLLY